MDSEFINITCKALGSNPLLMKVAEAAVKAYSLKPGYKTEFDEWAKRVWNVPTYHDFVRMADHSIALTSETDFEAYCSEWYRQSKSESHNVLIDRIAYKYMDD